MDQYAVFGNPINHSRSPFIHQQFALQTRQTMNYQAIQVELGGFAQATRHFFDPHQANDHCARGANVTVPFKEEAFAICTRVSERAQTAGAVNTLLKMENAEIHGDNTDGVGLIRDLHNHGVTLANQRILLLGAGGAARGVIMPLLAEGPATLVVSNRTSGKAEKLVASFAQPLLTSCALERLDEQGFDLIINATSAGLSGNIPALPLACLTAGTVCYDMLYLRATTPFNHWAQANDVRHTIDGLGMLVEQAAESFSLWRGVTPDTKAVLQQLRRML